MMTPPRSYEAYPITLDNDALLDVNSDGKVILVDCDEYSAEIDENSTGDTITIHNEGCAEISLYVTNVLALIDEYTLNTTANDLRAQLAAANETIAQLRKADTVRPEAIEIDSGSVSSVQRDAWDEGFGSGVNEAMNGFISKRNPYGDP
jgi:hypothetical protein